MASSALEEVLAFFENTTVVGHVICFGVFVPSYDGPSGACFQILAERERKQVKEELVDVYIPDAPPLTDKEKYITVDAFKAGLGHINGIRAEYAALSIAVTLAKQRRYRNVVFQSSSTTMEQIVLKDIEKVVPHLDLPTSKLYSDIWNLLTTRMFTSVRFLKMNNLDDAIQEAAIEGSYMNEKEAPMQICLDDDFMECVTIRLAALSSKIDENGGAGVLLFPSVEFIESYPISTLFFQEGLGGVSDANVALYRAFVLGLRSAKRKGYKNVVVEGDSNLIDSKFVTFTMKAEDQILRKEFRRIRFRRIVLDEVLFEQAQKARFLAADEIREGVLAPLFNDEEDILDH